MESTIAFANLLIVSKVVHVGFFQDLMKKGDVREATKYAINLTNVFLREEQRRINELKQKEVIAEDAIVEDPVKL
jgi:hypothetical protein